MELRGVAAAIHGRTLNRFTVTVLQGADKKNIVMDPVASWGADFPPPHDEKGIKGVLERFFGTISRAVKTQSGENNASKGPVVSTALGIPSPLNSKLFLKVLNNIQESLLNIGDSSKKKRKKDHSQKDNQITSIFQKLLNNNLQRHGLTSGNVRLQMRSFELKDVSTGINDMNFLYGTPSTTSISLVQDPVSLELYELHERFSRGDEDAKQRIKEIIIDLAKSYAEKTKRHFSNANTSRFILLAPNKPPFNTDPKNICITWNEEFRELFKDTLSRELGMKPGHNFVLKAPTDPPSPPYADVVRAMMMDTFDKLTS